MKNNKKAFTIVELVIVIAVIAILAAVLIPTFSSLIEKANINSDTAAVRQMNSYLAADEIANGNQKPSGWEEVVKILNKSGLDVHNYKALSAEHDMVYDSSVNRILYVLRSTQEVVYPEEYAKGGELELGYNIDTRHTLTGEAVADDSWRYEISNDYTSYIPDGNIETSEVQNYVKELKDNNAYSEYYGSGAATIAALSFRDDTTIPSGMASYTISEKGITKYVTLSKVNSNAQLKSFMKYVKDEGVNGKDYTLFISGDIDLNNTQIEPIETYAGNIDGLKVVKAEDGTVSYEPSKLSNYNMSDRSAEVTMYQSSTEGGGYFYHGFISVFEGTYLGNLTFENVNVVDPGLDSAAPGDFVKTGHVTAVLAAKVNNYDNQNVLIENIKVEAGIVQGYSRVGGVVGMIGAVKNKAMTTGKVTLKNIENNAKVISSVGVSNAHGTVGGIAAATYGFGGDAVLEFINCVNNGDVTGQTAAGMIAINMGTTKDTTISFKDCVNNGKITATINDKKFDSPNVYTDKFNCNANAAGFIAVVYKELKLLSFENCKSNGDLCLENKYTTEAAKVADYKLFAHAFYNNAYTLNSHYLKGSDQVKTPTQVVLKNCSSDLNVSFDVSYAKFVFVNSAVDAVDALVFSADEVDLTNFKNKYNEADVDISGCNFTKVSATEVVKQGTFASTIK